jgi:hypothetical protein
MVKWLNGLPFAWKNHPMERSEIRMDNAMECNGMQWNAMTSVWTIGHPCPAKWQFGNSLANL